VRILGVDPGLRITGYGAIDMDARGARLVEAGIIAPAPSLALERRLHELYDGICAVLAALEPEVMVVEELWSAYRNPSTAVLMGHARGVICVASAAHGVRVRHLAHSMVKRALVGFGAARKQQVKRMVVQQLHLREDPEPDDVSDALALALALANVESTERRFAALNVRVTR
jgi:crossover junction endodeoxyribonuclease RuvC